MSGKYFAQCFSLLEEQKDTVAEVRSASPPLWLIYDALGSVGVPLNLIPKIQLLLGVAVLDGIKINRKNSVNKGAFGKIYDATMCHMHGCERVVAKKCANNELCVREATQMSRFAGGVRGIVGYYGLANVDSSLYIIMRMASSSMQDVLGGVFVKNATENIVCDMLTGLSRLHEHGLVHGDISCRNILLNYSNTVNAMIADFGSTETTWIPAATRSKKLQKCLIQTAYMCQTWTPGYATPEPIVTSKTDMWAMGCVIAKMTMNLDMTGDDDDEIRRKLSLLNHYAFGKLTGPSGKRILTLLHGLLKYDYRQRITADEALAIMTKGNYVSL